MNVKIKVFKLASGFTPEIYFGDDYAIIWTGHKTLYSTKSNAIRAARRVILKINLDGLRIEE